MEKIKWSLQQKLRQASDIVYVASKIQEMECNINSKCQLIIKKDSHFYEAYGKEQLDELNARLKRIEEFDYSTINSDQDNPALQ